MTIQGQIADIHARRIYKGEITIKNGKIISINEAEHDQETFILPGFVDAHIHIESSMLVPSEFARIAVRHGTVATVSDPHEIANVLGVPGVEFMIENGKKVPFKFNFGAPSCVPATLFETAGAVIDSKAIDKLLQMEDIRYLSEMMNYPGVIHKDPEVMKKIDLARKYGKPVDGHAPGLTGTELDCYIAAGISSDHECFTYEEGLEKIRKGMKILIREGSAAKNFEALIPLLAQYPDKIMFCSDDKHPDDLLIGHINRLCARALEKGHDLFDTLRAASLNPVLHYGLDLGLLRSGDPADFVIVRNLKEFEVLETYINGQCVFADGKSKIEPVDFPLPNNFNTGLKKAADFRFESTAAQIRVIEALDGELITRETLAASKTEDGNLVSDPERDILKMSVVNRYSDKAPAIAFIKNFGLKEGAIASSVGHDSHNILAVGTSDEAISRAVNLVIEARGGISAVSGKEEKLLALPVAGIMSDKDARAAGRGYSELTRMAKAMGSKLHAPYMTLSFMALLVIPELKLSDKGLFNGKRFAFTPLEVDEIKA